MTPAEAKRGFSGNPVAAWGRGRDRSCDAFLFGYGSLVDRRDVSTFWRRLGKRPAAMFDAELPGFRREWNVAMDNTRDLAGYKSYTDMRGRRPTYVAFLNVMPAAMGRSVNGLCFAVDRDMLAALDGRERNYERIDVSAAIRPSVAGPVWCYVGSRDALARFKRGVEGATAVIAAAYRDQVHGAFKAKGVGAYEQYLATTTESPLPVLELIRHEVPSLRPRTGPRPSPEPVSLTDQAT